MGKLTHILRTYWPSILIVAIGLLIRLYNLTAISLWHDEAFSALLIKYSWSEMMYRIGLDVHPPMYYIFLRVWYYLFGDSLFALRGLSVFFGVGTIIATYAFINAAFKNKKAALIAAALIAVNPFQVQYVTEARMYTMGAFFAVLAAYFLVKALHGQRQYYELQKNNIPRDPEMLATRRQFMCHYFWFVVSCSVMMYTHYYLLFAVAGLGLYGVWYHLRTYKDSFTKYGWIVLSGILMLILYVPWLKTFIFQFNQVGAGYWIPPMNRWSIPRTLWEILIKIAEPGAVTMILVSLLMLVALVQVIRKYSQPEKWLVIFSFIAPFAGAILFLILAKLRGGSSSVYLVRYFLFSSSFTIMVLALWFEVIRPTLVKKIVIGLFVVLNLFAIGYYWNQLNPAERPGMAAAAELLRTNVEPNHKLFVGSSFQFFNYKYYNQTPIQPLLYTNNHTVEDLPHYAGTAILTNNDLVLDFTKATKSGDTVWLLWTTGFGGTKPEVPANWTQVDEHGYAEIRPYVGTWVIVTQYKVK